MWLVVMMTNEEAIKTLRELWRETNDTWYEEVYNMAIEALSKLTGKWIEYEPAKVCWNGEEVYAYMNNYTCSVCGGEAHIKYDYCPNCGARMI